MGVDGSFQFFAAMVGLPLDSTFRDPSPSTSSAALRMSSRFRSIFIESSHHFLFCFCRPSGSLFTQYVCLFENCSISCRISITLFRISESHRMLTQVKVTKVFLIVSISCPANFTSFGFFFRDSKSAVICSIQGPCGRFEVVVYGCYLCDCNSWEPVQIHEMDHFNYFFHVLSRFLLKSSDTVGIFDFLMLCFSGDTGPGLASVAPGPPLICLFTNVWEAEKRSSCTQPFKREIRIRN